VVRSSLQTVISTAPHYQPAGQKARKQLERERAIRKREANDGPLERKQQKHLRLLATRQCNWPMRVFEVRGRLLCAMRRNNYLVQYTTLKSTPRIPRTFFGTEQLPALG